MQNKHGVSDNCEELNRQHKDLDTASATETFRVKSLNAVSYSQKSLNMSAATQPQPMTSFLESAIPKPIV